VEICYNIVEGITDNRGEGEMAKTTTISRGVTVEHFEFDMTELQRVLTDAYEEYRRTSTKRHISDNQFARWLGISPVNFNYYINGNRRPSLEQVIIMSRRLGRKIFEVCGYDPVYQTDDPLLLQVIDHWSSASREIKEEIIGIITGNRHDVYKPPATRDGDQN
jgi:carbohydrate-binding DOMON domain-containing protein